MRTRRRIIRGELSAIQRRQTLEERGGQGTLVIMPRVVQGSRNDPDRGYAQSSKITPNINNHLMPGLGNQPYLHRRTRIRFLRVCY
jgi:hypothetical protein